MKSTTRALWFLLSASASLMQTGQAPLVAAAAQAPQDPAGAADIIGIWTGTATANGETARLAFEISKVANGIGVFMTLPRLHAWRMPLDYATRQADGTWAVPSWHITLRREGESLTGTYADGRVRFVLARAPALPAEVAPPALPPGPMPDWTYGVGATLWASPTSRDGIVYAADTRGTLHAVRAADGAPVWRVPSTSPIFGAPTATADSLYVFDDGGVLRRMERSTGRVIWRRELGGDAAPRVLPAHDVFDFDFHAPSPVLHTGSIVVTTSGGVVHVIDAGSGTIQWKRELGAKVRATAAASDALIIVGTLAGDLVALDRRSGRERWRFKAAGPVTSAATITNGLVLFASRGGWLTALDGATGRERWARFYWSSWIESDGVMGDDGLFYVGSSDLRVTAAIDPASGKAAWQTDVLGWSWGTPAVTSDTVYVGVAAPRQYVTKHAAGLVALDRRTGAVRWRREILPGDGFLSGYPGSVVISNGVLVAPNVNGTLEGFRLRRQTGPRALAAPAPELEAGPDVSHAVGYYDPSLRRVVLIGGNEEPTEGIRDRMWTWDGARWELTSGAAPPARWNASVAYDERRQVAIVAGGARKSATGASVEVMGDTWQGRGRNWQRGAGTELPALDHHAMVYDESRHAVIAFGGIPSVRSAPWPTDTWQFTDAGWTRLAADGPEGRGRTALAFDRVRGHTVLFGGVGAPPGPGQPQTFFGDTWVLEDGRWRKVGDAGPPGRYAHAMVFDEQAGVVLLFGGASAHRGAELSDMWQWDGRRWTEIGLSGPTPGPRYQPVMVYDRARRRTVLYGGLGRGSGGTWEWDGRRWTEIRP